MKNTSTRILTAHFSVREVVTQMAHFPVMAHFTVGYVNCGIKSGGPSGTLVVPARTFNSSVFPWFDLYQFNQYSVCLSSYSSPSASY